MKEKDRERPAVESLPLPICHESPVPDSFRQAYWLKLADIALGHAREEQERIKEKIKPHVERYKQISRNKGPRGKAA